MNKSIAEFRTIKEDNYVAVFVNTKSAPVGVIPKDLYRYNGNPNNDTFEAFRLFTYKYSQDNQIIHEVDMWKRITVKDHCRKSFVAICDMMETLNEFIL